MGCLTPQPSNAQLGRKDPSDWWRRWYFNQAVMDAAEVKGWELLINRVWKPFNAIIHIHASLTSATSSSSMDLFQGNKMYMYSCSLSYLICPAKWMSAGGIAVSHLSWMPKGSRFISIPWGADILTHLSVIYSVPDSTKRMMCFARRLCGWGSLTYAFSLSKKGCSEGCSTAVGRQITSERLSSTLGMGIYWGGKWRWKKAKYRQLLPLPSCLFLVLTQFFVPKFLHFLLFLKLIGLGWKVVFSHELCWNPFRNIILALPHIGCNPDLIHPQCL